MRRGCGIGDNKFLHAAVLLLRRPRGSTLVPCLWFGYFGVFLVISCSQSSALGLFPVPVGTLQLSPPCPVLGLCVGVALYSWWLWFSLSLTVADFPVPSAGCMCGSDVTNPFSLVSLCGPEHRLKPILV